MLIFLEEDLTLLPHHPHRANQGSICFIHFHLSLLYYFLRTLRTMFNLSVTGVNEDTLETTIALDLFVLFNSRCVIKLREILVRAILAPN